MKFSITSKGTFSFLSRSRIWCYLLCIFTPIRCKDGKKYGTDVMAWSWRSSYPWNYNLDNLTSLDVSFLWLIFCLLGQFPLTSFTCILMHKGFCTYHSCRLPSTIENWWNSLFIGVKLMKVSKFKLKHSYLFSPYIPGAMFLCASDNNMHWSVNSSKGWCQIMTKVCCCFWCVLKKCF